MTRVRAFFSGHPRRIAAALATAALAAVVFWYLASPLWTRTYADEALPVPRTPAPTFGMAPDATREPMPTAAERAVVRARGELGYVDQLHNGRGEVHIVEVGARRFVRFESVAITNAPDVHIYLSKDTGGRYVEANTVYLGPLKATNGSFNYEIPASVDLAEYRSVIVWCRAFSTLITWADVR